MIGAHALGILPTYKKINKTLAKCLVCGEYSECQIMKCETIIHVFYIKIKVLDEQFIFDWKKCNHRAILYDKKDVIRYKEEQGETGFSLVPYYHDMKLTKTSMPKSLSIVQQLAIVALGLLFGALVVYLMYKFDIRYIF